eukprot:scaffold10153_cov111-Isochrysis_galbana.AAC.5
MPEFAGSSWRTPLAGLQPRHLVEAPCPPDHALPPQPGTPPSFICGERFSFHQLTMRLFL